VISLQVGDCWLWILIIFLFHRSLFSAMFIPHEDCTTQNTIHPSMWGGCRGGFPPLQGPGGSFPQGAYFLQPCLSQSDTEHKYALSSNDKLGSFLGRLHSDCHNLISLLIVPTQYLNTISVTILLHWLHEWLPCIHFI
jgi:hypothetical protein